MLVSLGRHQHLGILTDFAFMASNTLTLLTKVIAESPGPWSGTLCCHAILVNQLDKHVLVYTAGKPFEAQLVKLPQLQAVVSVRELYAGASACVK